MKTRIYATPAVEGLKLRLGTATHNFKWVKITYTSIIWTKTELCPSSKKLIHTPNFHVRMTNNKKADNWSDTRRCIDVESTTKTLIQRRYTVVCAVGS